MTEEKGVAMAMKATVGYRQEGTLAIQIAPVFSKPSHTPSLGVKNNELVERFLTYATTADTAILRTAVVDFHSVEQGDIMSGKMSQKKT